MQDKNEEKNQEKKIQRKTQSRSVECQNTLMKIEYAT